MPAPLAPRSDTSICVSCRKKFNPGDRVQIVHIVVNTGRNPAHGNIPGAWLSEEFEIAHFTCADATLSSVIIRT